MAATVPNRTYAFSTTPIAILAGVGITIMVVSLGFGAVETDALAFARQRATIRNAIDQHGLSLARELRVQTVWTEAYEKTRANDVGWMRSLYGMYLSQLLGYDRIYVLSGDDKLVYGFVPAAQSTSTDSAPIGTDLEDLLQAVRDPGSAAGYNVVVTDVALGDGKVVQHRAVADVRDIGGRPATVVVSTILPDRGAQSSPTGKPYLLVAVEDLDRAYTKRLGADFGLGDLEWVTKGPPAGDLTEVITARNGTSVGTLAWRNDQPGLEFLRRISLGLGLAMVLFFGLTLLLMRWSRQQAQRILASEANARLAARTDVMTGLPNRLALREIFPRLIDEAKRSQSTLGVMSVDIDAFAGINDNFGTAVGDAALLAVGKRLQRLLRPLPILVRPGGDDFMILVPGPDAKQLAELAQDVVACVAEPMDLEDGTRIFITASVGYALAPHDGDSGDDLARRTQLALSRAKKAGGGVAIAFEPQMDLELSQRSALEAALRKAVNDETISVVYQPLMNPSGSRVVGAEALARWTDPVLGTISPDVFIPLAEDTGLIPKIGEFVLRRAVRDAADWQGISVAVNVSAAQMYHGDIVALVQDVLSCDAFPPARLEVEITESVLLEDGKRASDQIKQLQALGVKVALDDFGIGYSSLHYLRSFGFDKLKIDRSFLEGVDQSGEGSVILASIIQLGLDLNLIITAEGVETPRQQRWLAAAGVHQMQGFLFARPMSAAQLGELIELQSHEARAAG